MTTPLPIRAPKPTPLSGEEVVAETDATVVDFWRFALSNLRMNNARGYLAEFLVAKAVGSTGLRVEWDPYDVLAPDGTTIEVKTSAYLQSWDQYKLSTIQFTGLRSRIWTTEGGLTPTPHVQRRSVRLRDSDGTHPRGVQPAPGLAMALPRPSQGDGRGSWSGIHWPGNLGETCRPLNCVRKAF